MKFTGVALILLCHCGAIASTPEGRSSLAGELPKMVGKSREKLKSEHAKVLARFQKEGLHEIMQPTPWYVWHFKNAKSQDRYVMFSGQPMRQIPGACRCIVRLFSGSGEMLGLWDFSTGWRINLDGAEFVTHRVLKAPTIIINSTPSINGQDVAKQFFSFSGDSLYFVGIQDSRGRVLRNYYKSPNHTFGVDVSRRTKTQWVKDLKSHSLVRQLAALTYIAGNHMNPDKPEEAIYSESVENAKVAAAVRDDESVMKAIAEYTKSEIEWLRKAAELAGRECAPADLHPDPTDPSDL